MVVLVGSNAAWCHPILYQRLGESGAHRESRKVVVIDPRRTATCDLADLHLALRPGSDAILFNGLLTYLHAHGWLDEGFVEDHTEGFAGALAAAQASAP
ncbi:MAG: nitrate reductase, partial [Nitrospirae bacterium CG18_big_fil_WC_8_21_14_2_50_70_55]